MATRPWIFMINTFYVNTAESMKNALTLTNDHVGKLTANEADAEILDIKNDYLPLHTGFVTAQNQLNSKLGIYHGQTQTFEELLHELGFVKINQWRGTVFSIFPEGTADAVAIFPRDREPFQTDTYDQRVEAVETLSITLATYTGQPVLLTLSAAVHTYHLTLTGARALQQTDEGSVETLRTNLKSAHRIMCTGLYTNLGRLMARYSSNPEHIADYYDLTLLRNTGTDGQLLFNGTIAGTTIFNFNSLLENAPFTPSPASVFRIKNTSANEVTEVIYPANSPAEPPGPGVQFPLTPGQTLEKTFAELGLGALAFLNIRNNSAFEGRWELEIME